MPIDQAGVPVVDIRDIGEENLQTGQRVRLDKNTTAEVQVGPGQNAFGDVVPTVMGDKHTQRQLGGISPTQEIPQDIIIDGEVKLRGWVPSQGDYHKIIARMEAARSGVPAPTPARQATKPSLSLEEAITAGPRPAAPPVIRQAPQIQWTPPVPDAPMAAPLAAPLAAPPAAPPAPQVIDIGALMRRPIPQVNSAMNPSAAPKRSTQIYLRVRGMGSLPFTFSEVVLEPERALLVLALDPDLPTSTIPRFDPTGENEQLTFVLPVHNVEVDCGYFNWDFTTEDGRRFLCFLINDLRQLSAGSGF